MIMRWWRIILHNPLLMSWSRVKVFWFRRLNSPSPFISFWDNHLFVYSDEHYRWCSKSCITRNKIDLASVRGEPAGAFIRDCLVSAQWSSYGEERRRKHHQFIVEWWQHVPDTLHWSRFLGSRSNHLKCNWGPLQLWTLYSTKWPTYSRPCHVKCFSLWL